MCKSTNDIETPKCGRPKLDIDPDEVYKLALLQCTLREIASFFSCDEKTIRTRFPAEIEKGRESGKMSLRRAQFKRAVDAGSDTMLIWLGKQYLGQREPRDIDIDTGVSKKMAELLSQLEKDSD